MRTIKLEEQEVEIIRIALKRMYSDFSLSALAGRANDEGRSTLIPFIKKLDSEIGNQMNGKSARGKRVLKNHQPLDGQLDIEEELKKI